MTGSLHVKNGKYYAVLNIYEDGQRKQKWITTGLAVKGNKRLADRALEAIKSEYLENLLYESSIKHIPYFHDYLEGWLEERKGKIEQSTWEGYEVYVKRHLVPYFKKKSLRINEVAPRHIKEYYELKFRGGRLDSKKGGLSIPTIKKHGSVLKMVFREAQIIELIDKNPAEIVPLPRQESVEKKAVFLTAKEANVLLKAFRGHELQPIVYVTLYYGLRRSEVMGLKWCAIDFDNDTLSINHTVVKNRSIVAKDRTKNWSSKGSFELLPDVKALLMELREEERKNRILYGNTYYDSDYIFTKPDGSLRRPDCVTRGFQRVLKNHQLKPMRFHDLRHSCASILYDKDWNVKDIQEWLRHSDVETSLNIYTHISKERRATLAKDMENTFRL